MALGGLAACTGAIGLNDGTSATEGESTGPGGTGAGPGGTGTGPGGTTAQAFAPATARLRKLTRLQYRNALRDLLAGPVTLSDDSLEPDSEKNGFNSIGASDATISPRGVEQYETAALAATKQAIRDDATRRTKIIGCAPASATAFTDDACTTAFLTKFIRRAYRRDASAEELGRWKAIAVDAQTKLTSFHEGIEMAVAGILTSPNFLFRVEIGEPDPEHPGRLRFTSEEMATRLSFFIKNTTPDDVLLDVAKTGALTKVEGVVEQANRLLATEGAKAALDDFFVELLHLNPLDTFVRDPAKFPSMSPTLGASMKTETLKMFEDIAFGRDADFHEIFDTTTTWVNADLAKVYGLPAPTGAGFVQITLPADGTRAGILGQAGFLAVNSHVLRSSPTYRGKAIRERFLCESMPPPPDNVAPLPEPDGSADRATARQRLEMHRKVEPCASCHKLMDPVGLTLENYDAIGAFRTTENSVTIDVSGDLDGTKFNGPRELGKLLRADKRTGPCFARNLFRHAAGHVETEGEEPSMTAITDQFSGSGYKVRALAISIVTSDAFRFAAAQETP